MTEEWRVVTANPAYEVSSEGRVRRVVGGQGTRGRRHILAERYCGKYLAVQLHHGGKATNAYVHTLVCEAFHGPAPTPDHMVAHWDGVKTNNRKDNLRWATRLENAADSIRQGVSNRGSRHGMAKLNEDQVAEIKHLLSLKIKQRDIAAQFGISEMAVSNIKSGHTWGHIPTPR